MLTYFWKRVLTNKLLENQWRKDIKTCQEKWHDPMSITLWNTNIEQIISFVEDLMDCDEED